MIIIKIIIAIPVICVLWITLNFVVCVLRYKRIPEGKNIVYISGKITGTNLMETKKRFDDKEKELDKICTAYNPMTGYRNNVKQHSWIYYMKAGISNLMLCDSIYMLKGWRKSKGAKIERIIAILLDYNIYYE